MLCTAQIASFSLKTLPRGTRLAPRGRKQVKGSPGKQVPPREEKGGGARNLKCGFFQVHLNHVSDLAAWRPPGSRASIASPAHSCVCTHVFRVAAQILATLASCRWAVGRSKMVQVWPAASRAIRAVHCHSLSPEDLARQTRAASEGVPACVPVACAHRASLEQGMA